MEDLQKHELKIRYTSEELQVKLMSIETQRKKGSDKQM